jgi:hypothetical protein
MGFFDNNINRHGVMLGVAIVLIDLLFYFISTEMYLKHAGWVRFAAYLFFVYKVIETERYNNDNIISFAHAFRAAWICYVIAGAISFVFTYTLGSMDEKLTEETLRISEEGMETIRSIVGDAETDALIDKLHESNPYSFWSLFSGKLFSFIFPGALIAGAFALIMKKDQSFDYAVKNENKEEGPSDNTF